jgi:flavin-dependent dehydrogenase
MSSIIIAAAPGAPGAGVPIASAGRGAWIVNDAIRAPLLVGAGGSGCPVARMLNGTGRGRPLVVAREAEADVSAAGGDAITGEPQVPELFFCGDLQGYGWCVRKGDYLNVGLGRFDPRSLPARRSGSCLSSRRPAGFRRIFRGDGAATRMR